MSAAPSRALVGNGLADLEVITRLSDRASANVNHYRPLSEARTLCGHSCDDQGAFGDWLAQLDAHPEDACEMPGIVCETCDASYRKARRLADGGAARRPDDRPAYKRDDARVRPKVQPIRATHLPRGSKHAAQAKPAADVFRMSGAALRELDSPEARAEIARRKAKRAAKHAARKAAA